MEFDLILRKVNLGNILWTIQCRVFNFCTKISHDMTVMIDAMIFVLVIFEVWLKILELKQNFNLARNFLIISDKALIYRMCISCDNNVLLVTAFMTLTL